MAGLQPGFAFTRMPIQLGGLMFGQVDSEGVHWHCGTLSGWDSPDVKTTITQREAAHGSWMGPVYLDARVVTLAGKAYAPSRAALDRAIERLNAAAGLTDTTLTVWETTPKQATVRRSGKVLAERLTDVVLDWSVLVTAPDPRRYSTTQQQVTLHLPSSSGGLTFPITFPIEFDAVTVSGDAVLPNAGTISSLPVIRIYGPVTQPSVVLAAPDGTTAALTYGDTIADGDWLDLDCDAHTALYNSQSTRRGQISGPWPQIPPGGAGVSFRAAAYSATARAVITYRDAWM